MPTNTLELFDFGEDVLVKPAHHCSPSCGNPCETYREIQEVESKIADMKQTLEATLDVYRGLRTKMNVLHDPFLCRVPLEVATTIFRLCLPAEFNPIYCPFILDTDREGEEYNARVLFTLGGVCKSWRQIIWPTPQFWKHLSICIKPATLSTSINIAKEWIDRSARIPLSIQVYLSNSRDRRFDEHLATEVSEEVMDGVKTLSEVINACSTRWESLDLRLPSNLFSMFHGQPSNLRELRMDNYNQLSNPDPTCLLAPEGAQKPTPAYVVFDFVRLKSVDISWSNVTCVETKGIDMQECVELLRLAPQLVQCSFGMIRPPKNAWTGPRDVIHHGIQDLKILIPVLGVGDEALDHFILPSLQNLTLQLYAMPLPVQNILSLIERSSCTLGWLDIGAVFDEEALEAMLRRIPSLWHLILKPCMTDDQFSAIDLFKLLDRTSWLPEDEEEEEEQEEEEQKQQQQQPHISPSTENNAETVLPVEHSSNPSVSNSNENNDEDVFLPELECLRYDHFDSGECARIWDLIPGAFGYKDRKEEDFNPELAMRPLRSLMVNLEPPPLMREGSLQPPGYISQSTLVQMKELRENGCDIDVWVGLVPRSEPEDFIARSIAFHSLSLQA